jgi:hypothetical protein
LTWVLTFCQGWPWTTILLITSWVARITGMSHRAWPVELNVCSGSGGNSWFVNGAIISFRSCFCDYIFNHALYFQVFGVGLKNASFGLAEWFRG